MWHISMKQGRDNEESKGIETSVDTRYYLDMRADGFYSGCSKNKEKK